MIVKNKGIILSDVDKEILYSLWRFHYLDSRLLSCICGQNEKRYVRGRLKQLANAGMIKRIQIEANSPAVNIITYKGQRAIDLPERRVVEPGLGLYKHTIGAAEIIIWTLICGHRYFENTCSLDDVVTERDIFSSRTMKRVGTRSDGQPIYREENNIVHRPDGYIVLNENKELCSIEYERISKSKLKTMYENFESNRTRFSKQLWVSDKESVISALRDYAISRRAENELIIVKYADIHREIEEYIVELPEQIAKKTGEERTSLVHQIIYSFTPVSRLPLTRLQYRKSDYVIDTFDIEKEKED